MKQIIKDKIAYIIGCIDPQAVVRIRYKKVFGKSLNLKEPVDLNEKIQWLKFNSDTSCWPGLADKYTVRKYVEKCGYGDMLNELYGVWEDANDIDFGRLPNSFVLKTNHASGTVLLVKDKNRLDISQVRKMLNKWLHKRYGIETGEPHYLKIPPRLIAENYLKQDGNLSSSLIDYKFYCFNGKPYNAMVCCDREIGGHASKIIYDLKEWKPRLDYVKKEYQDNKIIPRPKTYDQMISACCALAKNFPLLRVDFYEVKGKAYFGELTFTSEGGFIYYLTPEYLRELGNQLILPRKIK